MVNWFPGTYLHRLIWVEWKETFYWEMFSRSRAGTRTGEEKGRNYRKVAWWCYLGSVTWSRSVLHGETGYKRPQGHSVLLKTQVTTGWRTLWLCMELSKLWLSKVFLRSCSNWTCISSVHQNCSVKVTNDLHVAKSIAQMSVLILLQFQHC